MLGGETVVMMLSVFFFFFLLLNWDCSSSHLSVLVSF